MSVLFFVLVASQINMFIYATNSSTQTSVYNQTSNTTVIIRKPITVCYQSNPEIVLAQDMIFMFMRIILPFIIMVICNVILVNHISKTRNVVIRGRKEKRENNFTLSVSIMNGSFLICNIALVIYNIIFYYLKFSGASWSFIPFYINYLFGTCATVLSYIFTLSQFFIDLTFNKVFRKQVISLLMYLTRLRFRMVFSTNRRNIQESNL